MTDLHVKYRPQSLDEIKGHDQVVSSIASLILEDNSPHSYLFTGEAGVGKTTMARILATCLGCDDESIYEIDGASNSKVDDIQELVDFSQYPSIFGGNKAIILDECHRLTDAAFSKLLKPLEEPPKYLYWILCTNTPNKVKNNIKSRLHAFNLKALPTRAIYELLEEVRQKEEWKNLPQSVVEQCAISAKGSPRQALVNLNVCHECESVNEAKPLLAETESKDPEFLEFANQLLKVNKSQTGWKTIVRLLKKIDMEPWPLRQALCSYFQSVLESNPENMRAVSLLDNLMEPVNDPYHKSSIHIAIARTLLMDS